MRSSSALFILSALTLHAQVEVRTTYNVKYVAEGAVYLDGGRAAGLAERMKLTIRVGRRRRCRTRSPIRRRSLRGL